MMPAPLIAGGFDNPAEEHAAMILKRAMAAEPAPSAISRARIGAGIFDKLAAPPPKRFSVQWLAVATACACLAFATGWWVTHISTTKSLTIINGSLICNQGAAAAIDDFMPMKAECSPGAQPAFLKLDGQLEIKLAAGSALVAHAVNHFALNSGTATFEVAPRQPGQTFSVDFAEGVVEVVGTAFSVSHHEGSGSAVVVSHGTVRLKVHEQTYYLSSGQMWATTMRPALVIDETFPAFSLQSKSSAGAGNGALFAKALALIEAGNFTQAAEIYQKIAAKGDSSAETALYYWARLEAQSLGHPQEALLILNEMGLRFPHGSLSMERCVYRIQLLLHCGRCPEAKDLASECRQAYPQADILVTQAMQEAPAKCE
jgi:hypothetical protein